MRRGHSSGEACDVTGLIPKGLLIGKDWKGLCVLRVLRVWCVLRVLHGLCVSPLEVAVLGRKSI